MIVKQCAECHAYLPAEELMEAIKRGEKYFICPHCGNLNQIYTDLGENVSQGYEKLKENSCYPAKQKFNAEIAKHKQKYDRELFDCYIGLMFADKRIIPRFLGDEYSLIPERFFLMQHDDESIDIKASTYFQHAQRCITTDSRFGGDDYELAKLNAIAEMLDRYDAAYSNAATLRRGITSSDQEKYNAVIIYEDDPTGEDYREGLANAEALAEDLKEYCRSERGKEFSIYVPHAADFDDETEYEAALLYASEHTNCMLVVLDGDPDLRITDLYQRYFTHAKGGDRTLGFVRVDNKSEVELAANKLAGNVFDIENKLDYINFARICNQCVALRTLEQAYEEVAVDFEEYEPQVEQERSDDVLQFGVYPQRAVQDDAILEQFRVEGVPSARDNNGWTVMFCTRDERHRPYTWYKDKELVVGKEIKKYRAVYFTKSREKYIIQEGDAFRPPQTVNGYVPRYIYCFEFEPICWNIISKDIYGLCELACECGIDSRSFSEICGSSGWEQATLREWLNNDFMATAFSVSEKEQMQALTFDENADRVFLMDIDSDDMRVCKRERSILGTDYMRCIGGQCGDENFDKLVNSYWVLPVEEGSDSNAKVVIPSSQHGILSTKPVDETDVAVVPKIVIRLLDEHDD